MVYAGAESGFYLGGGVGDTAVSDNNFDENMSSLKFFGGYNFGIVPFLDLAAEVTYIDFGSSSGVKVNGITTFGIVGFSFGPIGIFGKIGAINWDLDFPNGSESGTDPAYGIGARFQFSSFAVRAEYELYDVSNIDELSMLSASFVYTF